MSLNFNTNQLYLASSSKSRQWLLDEIKINYKVISQDYDEHSLDWSLPIDQLVLKLAINKMDHAIIPEYSNNKDQVIWVLTADTLSQDLSGNIHGKPIDYQDAVSKIKKLREGSFVYSAFCLDKKIYDASSKSYKIIDRKTKVVSSKCIFKVPDSWIDTYIKNSDALYASGAIVIDQFGLQFLESIEGSYTNIIGLPLFELKEDLQNLGFFL